MQIFMDIPSWDHEGKCWQIRRHWLQATLPTLFPLRMSNLGQRTWGDAKNKDKRNWQLMENT